MTYVVTAENIRQIAPGASSSIVQGIIDNQHLLAKYGIDTPLRLAHFFGQCALETAGFTRLEENLYYTTTTRLRQVWPSRFKTTAAAAPYVRNPEKLANLVYGGRLGNNLPGDGWRYRGSGMKQTTGKYNFSRVEAVTKLPVVANPDMLRKFPEALEAACIFWKENNLSRFADRDDVLGLTKAINGGTNGLSDRRIYTDRAKRVKWGQGQVPPVGPVDPNTPDAMIIGPTLREGAGMPPAEPNTWVKKAQERLKTHGTYGGAIDGRFGPGTDAAVLQFQEIHNLMRDGVIGPVTWKMLMANPLDMAKDEVESLALEPLSPLVTEDITIPVSMDDEDVEMVEIEPSETSKDGGLISIIVNIIRAVFGGKSV
jgi:putative chitinase